MNELVGEKHDVLDDGFVRLIDYFGSDEAIAQAARVSYSKGTKTVQDDANLVRYLMRHEHFSPFSMCQVKLHARMPLFINVQWLRHDRFHWNLMSARYSVMPKEKWLGDTEWRMPSSTNKQAGDALLDTTTQIEADTIQSTAYSLSERYYQELLELNVCREQARSVLAFGQYTEGFVTANLGDWLLFLRQRMDPHAQKEIQVYANVIYDILYELFPVTMQAFIDYQYKSVSFSRLEMNVVRDLLSKNINIFDLTPSERVKLLEEHGLDSKRERVEFFKKIK
tara:strand:+ start:1219 stop:2061 length:843 start_codon:yes stop_codon:yes gene_type:complete